jgi:hypothetical protein
MTVYFGRVGAVLTEIQSPRPGVDRTPTAHEGTHELLAGGYAVDRVPTACRTWEMDWAWDDDVWWTLWGFYSGTSGFGPYCLYDEGAANLLSANQSSGTEPFADTTGFSIAGGASETIASSTTFAYAGSRSLKWSLPAAVTSGILTLAAPSSVYGWPVAAGPWTFSAYVRTGAGGDTSFSVALALRWLDSTGTQVSETVATATTVTTSWVQLTATGSAPSTAVYVVPRIKVTAATVAAVADLHVDQAQLQLGGEASTWRPGEGVPIVSLTKPKDVMLLADATTGEYRRNISATFVQLAVGS